MTWWIPQNPEDLAMASAQAELQILLPRLEVELRQLADDLLRDRYSTGRVFESALDSDGMILQKPERQEPVVLDYMGNGTAAFGLYRDGLEQTANPEKALLSFQEAASLCPEEATGLALQIDLAQVPLLRAMGKVDQSTALLEKWLSLAIDSWTLRGRPVKLILAYRLLEILEESEDSEASGKIRATIRQNLLSGRWPLSEQEVRLELSFLGPSEGGQPTEKEEDLLSQELGFRRLLQTMPRKPTPGATTLDEKLVLLVSMNRRMAAAFPIEYVQSVAEQRLRMIMGEDNPFSLSSLNEIQESPAGPSAFLTAKAVGLSGWQVYLEGTEMYLSPIQSQQRWMFIGAISLSLSFVAIMLIGRRMFARERLLQQTRSDFLAGVSHELRTPAASLAMLSENLLEERVSGKERLQEYYQSMRQDARRLEMLVADVLDLSRMERGKFSIELKNGSLVQVVQDLVGHQRRRFQDAGITLNLTFDASLPEIEMDFFAVERACANILENVRRYAATGKVAEIQIRHMKNSRILLSICDRGPGIPESWMERIFEPYERLPSAERMAVGAGLGLALAKAVMQAHGGSISVANRSDGRGACFQLEFPCDE